MSTRARRPQGTALRVGITGHRLDKLPPGALDEVRGRLAELFAGLDRACAGHGDAEPPWLVSALAEGADRLAVDAAPPGWRLAVLLPMSRARYRRDFLAADQRTSASAEAFDTYLARALTIREPDVESADPEAAYAALGQALLEDVDCLVAVWDGAPPRGPGGTAAVVAQAVAREVPVLWVAPDGLAPARRITGFAEDDLARPRTEPADEAALAAIAARA